MPTQKIFDTEMQKLINAYNFNFTANPVIWKNFLDNKSITDEEFKLGIDSLIMKDRFPSLGQLTALCLQIREDLRLQKHEHVKKEEQSYAEKIKQGDYGEINSYGKQCIKLVLALTLGKITRYEYLNGLEKLGTDIKPLLNYYQTHKLTLNEYSGKGN